MVVGLFIAQYLIGALFLDLRTFWGIHPRDVWGVISLLGYGIVFSASLIYKNMSYRALFHSSPVSVAATLGVLTLPVLLVIPGIMMTVWTIDAVLQWAFPLSHWHQAMFERMMSNGVASVIAVCVLAPFLEEMLFRGVILRSFLCQYRPLTAILVSAAIFAAAHMNIYQFPVAFGVGVLSGWLYACTRSLWPCILLHAAYNSTVTWLYFSSDSIQIDAAWQPPIFLWIGAFILAFIGTSFLRRFLSLSTPADDIFPGRPPHSPEQ